MRKTLLILLTLFAGMGNTIAENSVSVSPALIPQGKKGSFNIELTNTDTFVAFQMALTLPEGITFLSATKGNRYEESHSLGVSQSGQTVTLTINSGTNEDIRGNSGALVTISVSADADIEVGTKLTATLDNMEFSRKDETFIRPNAFNFDIEITDKVILDENSELVPTATDEEVDILVKRTIKAGQWNTICLPFDMTEKQVHAAFGDDVQIAELDIYDEAYTLNDDGTITVFFADANLSEGLYGNWPYIIRTSGDISQFEVHAKLIPAEEEAVAEYETGSGKNKKTIGSFTGTLHAGAVIPSECLFLSGNKFWYSAGKTVSKAFRAWFWFEDVLEDLNSAEARISLSFNDGETSGIDLQFTDLRFNSHAVYDPQGRCVEHPGKGLFIRDGKKIVVR